MRQYPRRLPNPTYFLPLFIGAMAVHGQALQTSDRSGAWQLPSCEEMSRACAPANAQACVDAGDCLLAKADPGKQTRNTEIARDLFTQACELDFGRGCSALGTLLGAGFRMPIDRRGSQGAYARAGTLLVAECRRGDALSCTELARLLDEKQLASVPETADVWFERGMTLLVKQCERGEPHACVLASSALTNAPASRKNSRLLRSVLEHGCAQGDGWSCCQLAQTTGGDRERLQLMERACASKGFSCCADAARIYAAAGALERAAALYEMACAGGLCQSCLDLADAYEHGRGVRVDLQRAAELRAVRCALE